MSVLIQSFASYYHSGVTICYKIDGQLMHCKKPTEEVLMWILNDISLACDTAEKLRVAVTTMDATFLRWGLTISTKKTKVLVVGRNAAAQAASQPCQKGHQTMADGLAEFTLVMRRPCS